MGDRITDNPAGRTTGTGVLADLPGQDARTAGGPISPRLHRLAITLNELEQELDSLPRRSRRRWRMHSDIVEIRAELKSLARAENRCVDCLVDLDCPSAAVAEHGYCGPCANEVPF